MDQNDTEQRDLERAVLDWTYTAKTGLSSEAIAYTAVKGTPHNLFNHPHDPDDLRRCLLLIERIPATAKALPTLAEASPFWDAIAGAWDTLSASLREEWSADLSNPEWQHAAKTYEAMRALLAPVEEEFRKNRESDPSQPQRGDTDDQRPLL